MTCIRLLLEKNEGKIKKKRKKFCSTNTDEKEEIMCTSYLISGIVTLWPTTTQRFYWHGQISV